MAMHLWAVSMGVGLLLAAVALIAVGMRGRRVSDAPHCRRCRFELAVSQPVCPECGADVTSLRAVRMGRRAPRRRLVAAGVAMLFVLALIGGTAGFMAARGVNWNRHKPLALLLYEAGSRDAAAASAAATELARRDAEEKLTREQQERVLAKALAVHADNTLPWPPDFDLVIIRGVSEGRLAGERLETYLRNIAHATLEFEQKETPWPNDSVTVYARFHWRSGRARPSGPQFMFAPKFVFPADARFEDPRFLGRWYAPSAPSTSIMAGRVRVPAEPGTYRLKASALLIPVPELMDRDGFSISPECARELRGMRLEWPAEMEYVVEPEGTGMPRLFRDDNMPEQIRASLHTLEATVSGTSRPQVMLRLSSAAAPADLSFDVFVRQGAREWPMAPLTGRKGKPWPGHGVANSTPGLDQDIPVDIVMRTNISHVQQYRRHYTAVWDGEVIIPGIRLLKGQ